MPNITQRHLASNHHFPTSFSTLPSSPLERGEARRESAGAPAPGLTPDSQHGHSSLFFRDLMGATTSRRGHPDEEKGQQHQQESGSSHQFFVCKVVGGTSPTSTLTEGRDGHHQGYQRPSGNSSRHWDAGHRSPAARTGTSFNQPSNHQNPLGHCSVRGPAHTHSHPVVTGGHSHQAQPSSGIIWTPLACSTWVSCSQEAFANTALQNPSRAISATNPHFWPPQHQHLWHLNTPLSSAPTSTSTSTSTS